MGDRETLLPRNPASLDSASRVHTSLGTNIRIESYARETGERYGIIGAEGTHFKRIPDEDTHNLAIWNEGFDPSSEMMSGR